VLRDDHALTSFSGEIATLGHRLARALSEKNTRLVTAESCTAGLLGACVAAAPGSTSALEGSYITYRPSMKVDALGVSQALIGDKTVYDPEVARAMAEGSLLRAKGAGLAVAVTGVAGPEPDQGKPVGLVYIATLLRGGTAQVTECDFSSETEPRKIVTAAIRKALELALAALDGGVA
jgi:PncC family amidohydrolase